MMNPTDSDAPDYHLITYPCYNLAHVFTAYALRSLSYSSLSYAYSTRTAFSPWANVFRYILFGPSISMMSERGRGFGPLPLYHHSSLDLPGTFEGLSRKRRRSPMTSVPALSPVSGALSTARADLIPSPKRVKDSGYLAEVEVDHRETSLRDDDIVRVSDEPHLEQDIDPEILAEIDVCFAYADALRDRGIDARVIVEAIDRDETETGVRGRDIEIVGVESAVIALTERIAELERDNRRLRDTMSVKSQRVD
ncbi:hypothetical protein Tco_0534247 [Tanacetum coccineum]